MKIAPLFVGLLLCSVGGCAGPFDKRFAKVQNGLTREQVTSWLGAPQARSDLGPAVEQWEYVDGDRLYLVLFSDHEGIKDAAPAKEKWRVARTESMPRDSFEAQFHRVKPGQSRAEVLALLGQPKTKQEQRYDFGFGPQESLGALLKRGSSYEAWHYLDNKTHFWIFFGSSDEKPKEQWPVLHKAAYPEGVVF